MRFRDNPAHSSPCSNTVNSKSLSCIIVKSPPQFQLIEPALECAICLVGPLVQDENFGLCIYFRSPGLGIASSLVVRWFDNVLGIPRNDGYIRHDHVTDHMAAVLLQMFKPSVYRMVTLRFFYQWEPIVARDGAEEHFMGFLL